MQHNVALLVVFYPGIEDYLNDFILSLRNQTYKNFDLIVVNDGFTKTNIKEIYPEFNIFELESAGSIAKNRELAINKVLKLGYKYLVLCDPDDYYDSQRIELSINALQDADIVINDVIVFNKGSILVEDYYSYSVLATTNINLDYILEKNLLGFSNTALKLDEIDSIVFPEELKIVDWYFYTILLLKGLKVKFIPKGLTFYRQHCDNLIGMTVQSSEEFRKLLKFKLDHYSFLSEINTLFVPLRDKMVGLTQLKDNQIEEILYKKRQTNKYPLWWEFINY